MVEFTSNVRRAFEALNGVEAMLMQGRSTVDVNANTRNEMIPEVFKSFSYDPFVHVEGI